MFNCSAISVADIPFVRNSRTLSATRRAVGTRPRYFLSASLGDALALTFEYKVPLKLGTAASTVSIILSVAVRVERLPSHAQDHQADALGLQLAADRQQVGGGASEPIRLSHNRSVALADEFQRGIQPGPRGEQAIEFTGAALRRLGDAVQIPPFEIPFPLACQRLGPDTG